MSRLIDADAMKQHYPIMENDFGMVFNEGLHKKLDLEPTVKAIPLDEIERKAHSGQWSDATIYEVLKAVAIIDKALKEQTE